jgi:hypothetical protein
VRVAAGFLSVGTLVLGWMSGWVYLRIRRLAPSDHALGTGFLVAAVGYALATVALVVTALTASWVAMALAGACIVTAAMAGVVARGVSAKRVRSQSPT